MTLSALFILLHVTRNNINTILTKINVTRNFNCFINIFLNIKVTARGRINSHNSINCLHFKKQVFYKDILIFLWYDDSLLLILQNYID